MTQKGPYFNSIYKGISYLHKRLLEEGITNLKADFNFRTKWLKPKEASGKLILPRHPGNPRIRIMTVDQVEEIVKAFSPGGKGRYPDKYN